MASSSKKILHNECDVFLIGNFSPEIIGNKLPTKRQVLKVLFFNLRQVKLTLQESARLAIKKAVVFWKKARIPTQSERNCIPKLKKLYEDWRSLQKSSNKKSTTQKEKEQKFIDKLENLFDIARENALELMKVEEDKEFLKQQQTKGYPGYMCGIDQKMAEKEKRRDEQPERSENFKRRKTEELDKSNERVELVSSSCQSKKETCDAQQNILVDDDVFVVTRKDRSRGRTQVISEYLGLEKQIKRLKEQNVRLQDEHSQMKNLLQSHGIENPKPKQNEKIKPAKPFDFSKFAKRHILLKFLYLGWFRQGFVVQEDTSNTVEAALFEALHKTKLIESRETSNYHRCGRTDKGVSAFAQVVSITVRSKLSSTDNVQDQTFSNYVKDELNYSQMLNRVLPADIRVIAWSPVAVDFSARFNCTSRIYKYFFPLGKLDLKVMNEAGQKLVGEHDFRNLCKMDVGNGVVKFVRKIFSISIREINCEVQQNERSEDETSSSSHLHDGYKMCVATIEAASFLWHQIRSIMTVLFLIGEGKEEPCVIEKLLDIKIVKRKPQYGFASEIGLNLYDAQYDNASWHYDEENIAFVVSQLQSVWTEHAIKSSMLHHMLKDLACVYHNLNGRTAPSNQISFCLQDIKTKEYKPLLERQTCEGLEERVKHFVKRRRLSPSVLEEIDNPD